MVWSTSSSSTSEPGDVLSTQCESYLAWMNHTPSTVRSRGMSEVHTERAAPVHSIVAGRRPPSTWVRKAWPFAMAVSNSSLSGLPVAVAGMTIGCHTSSSMPGMCRRSRPCGQGADGSWTRPTAVPSSVSLVLAVATSRGRARSRSRATGPAPRPNSPRPRRPAVARSRRWRRSRWRRRTRPEWRCAEPGRRRRPGGAGST